MITSLESPASLDPVRVGAKAAALAAANAAALPVVPGFVVEASASHCHMETGARALRARGSGGARLVVSAEPIDFAQQLIAAGEQLGDHLVARSSTKLEASGEWAGAFASYIDIGPSDLPKAVAGCWASAFSVDALQRQESAGIEPGSFPMAVLVQTEIAPGAGGFAELDSDGTVVVHGVKGSPTPLLQGWVTGDEARLEDGWQGDELIELVGTHHLDEIAAMLRGAASAISANRCEWALTDRVWALQFSRVQRSNSPQTQAVRDDLAELAGLARILTLAPGELGNELVLPWAIAGLPDVEIQAAGSHPDLDAMSDLASDLTRQVWNMPLPEARARTKDLIASLGAQDPKKAIATIHSLPLPDPDAATRLLAWLRSLRFELSDRGAVPTPDAAWYLDIDTIARVHAGEQATSPPRIGLGRWEPLVAEIVFASGKTNRGTAASPGIGAGRQFTVTDPHRTRSTHRSVVSATQPIPNLASLLWDSSGLVTSSGSPAAHLFEAARALRVPAVCGVDLGPDDMVVAVDGYSGVVATLDLGPGV